MAYFRSRLKRGLAICLLIFAAFGGVFALALLATAARGISTPSSLLLGGLGFILLVLSVLVLVLAISRWAPAKPGRNN